MKTLLATLTLIIHAPGLMAMPMKSQVMKSKAFFVECEKGYLEALDLKSKTLTFTKQDIDQCGANLVRRARTLTYSCTLPIPSDSRSTKLQNLVTPAKSEVSFGGTKRDVVTQVSADGKHLTYTTSFDATGIDFEVSKFNDDFFAVYNKVAQLVIADLMSRQPVRIEVLEVTP